MLADLLTAIALLILIIQPPEAAAGDAPQESLLAAAMGDGPTGGAAIAALRAAGQGGLDLVVRAAEEDRHGAAAGLADARWDQLIDAVGGARGDRIPRLFWYTDFAEAKQAARLSHRPIVALRLLGRLTDEFSCANSRFFRAVLYPDPRVSSWLREHAILYWSSERAVPQVSIDFGDGRVLRTTLGGNSVHLLLDAEGRPIDALPGLYGPAEFLARLQDAGCCATACMDGTAAPAEMIAGYHRQALAGEGRVLMQFGIGTPPLLAGDGTWSAVAAEAMTFSKGRAEMPMLKAVGIAPAGAQPADAGERPPFPPALLERLAKRLSALGALNPVSRGIIMRQLLKEGAIATGRDDQAAAAVSRVQAGLARDTIIDEYALHAEIHRHLLAQPGETVEALTAWIYADVFRTPAGDSWLGMRPTAWDGFEHLEVVAEHPLR